jgi:hypothetical protein
LPSDLTDSRGAVYWDYSFRLKQFAAFDEFIGSFPATNLALRDEMLRAHRADFIHRVTYEWGEIDRGALDTFERKVTRNYCVGKIPKSVRSVIRSIVPL